MAAIAVLAVAFVVLAAIPAVDAEDATTGPVKIGETSYSDLITAFTSVKENETITITESFEGSGIGIFVDTNGFKIATKFGNDGKATEWKSVANNVTIDLAGNTYTLIAPAVGSNGYETQGFHVEKGYNLTLKNGTIDISQKTSAVKLLFQNYSNLTLDNMVLDGTNLKSGEYTLSNNNGTVVIDDTTIKAPENGVAFDVYGFQKHDAVNVTVTGKSIIDGKIEFAGSQNDEKHELSLTINDGTINGVLEVIDSEKTTTTSKLTINGGTFSQPIQNSKLINVDKDGSLKADIVFEKKNASIVIADGGSFEGNVKFTDNEVVSSADVKIKAGSNGFTIKAGSIDFSGAVVEKSGSMITIISGEAKITENYTVPAGMTITVGKEATLTIADDKTLTVSKNATLTVAGNLSGNGAVTNNGTVESLNGGNIAATVSGNETTSRIDESEMENITIEGTVKGTDNIRDKDQLVTVKGNSVMAEDSRLVINGILYIPKDATFTLLNGAELVLASNAVLNVEGKLIIEEPYDGKAAKVTVTSGKIVVSGTVENGAEINVTSGSVDIQADGILIVGETGKLVSSKVSVEESGTLQVNGILGGTTETTVENAGTVVFDSEVASEKVIIVMKNGGAVDVKNLALKQTGNITIKDEKNTIVLKADTVTLKKVKDENGQEQVVTVPSGASPAAIISGVTVTEQITQNKDKTYTYVMDIAGNAAVSYVYVAAADENEPEVDTVKASITLSTAADAGEKDGIAVTGALTVGENLTLANAGKLTVSAAVDASKGAFVNKATINSTETKGTLTVAGEGKVVVKTEINDGTVNAARYVTGTDKLYNYVTLDAALAAANAGETKDIAVLGKQTLTASATLPKDVKLDLKDSTVLIGKDAEASDVTLTVAKGASVKNAPATVTVNGTVYAEDKSNIDTAVRAKLTKGADVYSEELNERGQAVRDGWAKWTNIATALIEAPENTVVKITKDLEIKADLTIPEKVTLDTNSFNVTVFPGVTVTDNGTLLITNNGNTFVLSNAVKNNDGSEKTPAAKIVLNGEIVSNEEIELLKGTYAKNTDGTESVTATEDKFIVGAAYYSMTVKNVTKYYATTVEKAAPLASTVDEQTITIKGDKLTVGDVAFEGKSVEEPATVSIEAKELKAASITLANTKIVFAGGQTFDGTIKDAAGSIVLKGTAGKAAEGSNAAVTFTVESGEAFAVSGDFTVDKDATVFSGAVSLKSGTISKAKVEGTLTVAGNAAITTIVVNGTVSIDAGVTFTVTDAEVFGTIAGAAKTTDKNEGKLVVTTMYIGFAKDEITVGAAASVTGAIQLKDHAVAAPGTTVPEAFTAENSEYMTTVLKVNGEVYATVYSVAVVNDSGCKDKLSTINPHVEDARFDGWYSGDDDVSDKTFPEVKEAEAKVVYDIYKIVIKADEGIADVYLNGQAMYYGYVYADDNKGAYYAYTATVSAGDYKVTYTLKNGWSGDAKLSGDNVTGMSFKASGTPVKGQDDIQLIYQLSGIEKSGYVEPVEPTEEKDDGMTITDYLLIILVVLIVILAIIVAMRLMRS